MSGDAPEHSGVIAPPPLIYAASLALGLLLESLAPSALLKTIYARGLGASLIVLGLALMGFGLLAMRRAATAVNPYTATTALVTDGPFRYSRNPLYLALTLVYLGIAFLAGTLWPFALLPAVFLIMHWGVIAREERYLESKFGERYRQYKARVRRWL